MECDVCKENSATIFLTQVVEGMVQKVNLCEGCAKSKGVTDPTGFDLAELLKGMGEETVQPKSSKGVLCANCGFSQSDFKKTGRMGCSECYVVFEEELEGLLKAMHKGTSHVGKVPGSVAETSPVRHVSPEDLTPRVDALQRKLEESIEAENYEEAARIRDQLRQLEAESLEREAQAES